MNQMNHSNGMYFGNGLPVNSPLKAEQLTDLNASKQLVYQNLQDYLKVNEMGRLESGQRPQLPPKNLTFKSAPPLPPCKPHLNTAKLSSNGHFKGQLEVSFEVLELVLGAIDSKRDKLEDSSQADRKPSNRTDLDGQLFANCY